MSGSLFYALRLGSRPDRHKDGLNSRRRRVWRRFKSRVGCGGGRCRYLRYALPFESLQPLETRMLLSGVDGFDPVMPALDAGLPWPAVVDRAALGPIVPVDLP